MGDLPKLGRLISTAKGVSATGAAERDDWMGGRAGTHAASLAGRHRTIAVALLYGLGEHGVARDAHQLDVVSLGEFGRFGIRGLVCDDQ